MLRQPCGIIVSAAAHVSGAFPVLVTAAQAISTPRLLAYHE